jgi:hypothetical protein
MSLQPSHQLYSTAFSLICGAADVRPLFRHWPALYVSGLWVHTSKLGIQPIS